MLITHEDKEVDQKVKFSKQHHQCDIMRYNVFLYLVFVNVCIAMWVAGMFL